MPERPGESVRVRIEASSSGAAAPAGYAAATLTKASTPGTRSIVLVPGAHVPGSDVDANAADCLTLPVPLDPALAILVPPLAAALAVWETLRLEIGDAAVWTGSGPLSALVGQTALWRGACPGIELGSESSGVLDARQVEHIELSDTEAAARLAELVAARPGFAAVDLSGRADVIDVLLEVIPRWGRLLLAGPPGTPVTIDYYRNVHRKGIVLATTILEPSRVFDAQSDARTQVARACAVLGNPRMAAQSRALLGLSASNSMPARLSAAG
jgi:threonine dehydrogenase-like Zn-dependent dehydrogenase